MGKSSITIPIPRRGVLAGILLGIVGVLLGLWLAHWIAFRERNPLLAADAGSWVPAAVLAGVALLAATWVGRGRIVIEPDSLVIYGRAWPVRIPASRVTGFTMRVTRRFGSWTEIVALDRTGFERRVCQIPGEPDGCQGLSTLLKELNSWCGSDVIGQREAQETDSVARMEEAAHRLADSNMLDPPV